jgi:hypothetical protein
VIEDDKLSLLSLDQIVKLLDLAAADQVFGGRLVTGNGDEGHRIRTSRSSQFLEFLRVFSRLRIMAFQMNKDGTFTTTWAFEKQSRLLSGVTGLRLLLFASAGQADGAARYNGGNGVFVDHLADGVLQQDHELVEGFDLALQLDAVD